MRRTPSFRRRLFAGFLAASLIPLLACSAMMLQIFRLRMASEAEREMAEHLTAAAAALDAAIDAFSQAAARLQNGTVTARALAEEGITSVLPDRSGQQAVMDIIYKEVKAGRPVDFPAFRQVARELADAGAQTVILACTELSLVKRDFELGDGFLDVMEVLARKAVLTCGRLKPRYECLLGIASASGECPV